MTVWINGEQCETVNANDRGLQYGDGLFETMRVYRGRVTLIEYHFDRLLDGCARLAFPPLERASLAAEIAAAARTQPDGVIKLIVTRGGGPRGYRPAADATVSRVLTTYPPPVEAGMLKDSKGIRVRIATTRLARQPRLAGIKHLNRLEQVLAAAESDDARFTESLMLDYGGCIIDGITTNLFWVKDGALMTPDLSVAGVAGVMRRFVMELAGAAGLPCTQRRARRPELDAADEVFVSNAVRGIRPVKAIEAREYDIGPVTRHLMAALAERWP